MSTVSSDEGTVTVAIEPRQRASGGEEAWTTTITITLGEGDDRRTLRARFNANIGDPRHYQMELNEAETKLEAKILEMLAPAWWVDYPIAFRAARNAARKERKALLKAGGRADEDREPGWDTEETA